MTSVDIDPELVAVAGIRLANHGYRPYLVTLHQQWVALGRPEYHRFGLTLERGSPTLWLDRPDSPHTWCVSC